MDHATGIHHGRPQGRAKSPVALFVHPAPPDGELVALATAFTPVHATTAEHALAWIERITPALVVVDLAVDRGADLCRAARHQVPGAVILVLAADRRLVPAALRAGCHSVLLRPLPINLLHTRLARLFPSPPGVHVLQAPASLVSTNRVSGRPCPTCAQAGGVVMFDAVQKLRSAFACTLCGDTWIARTL